MKQHDQFIVIPRGVDVDDLCESIDRQSDVLRACMIPVPHEPVGYQAGVDVLYIGTLISSERLRRRIRAAGHAVLDQVPETDTIMVDEIAFS